MWLDIWQLFSDLICFLSLPSNWPNSSSKSLPPLLGDTAFNRKPPSKASVMLQGPKKNPWLAQKYPNVCHNGSVSPAIWRWWKNPVPVDTPSHMSQTEKPCTWCVHRAPQLALELAWDRRADAVHQHLWASFQKVSSMNNEKRWSKPSNHKNGGWTSWTGQPLNCWVTVAVLMALVGLQVLTSEVCMEIPIHKSSTKGLIHSNFWDVTLYDFGMLLHPKWNKINKSIGKKNKNDFGGLLSSASPPPSLPSGGHVAQLLLGAELIEQRLRQNGGEQLHLANVWRGGRVGISGHRGQWSFRNTRTSH